MSNTVQDFEARVKAYFDSHSEPAGRLILDMLRALREQQAEIVNHRQLLEQALRRALRPEKLE